MCAQNKDTGVYASGVFSSYKSGACVRPDTSVYDAKYDAVALSLVMIPRTIICNLIPPFTSSSGPHKDITTL